LSCKSNSENICKKITAGICAIRRVKPSVDKDTLISIYNAIVRPYFDYCCDVWDVFGESQSKRLQKLQNRAARIILNMSNDVNHSIPLRALGWEKAKAKMMYKVLNRMGPKSLTNLFSYKCEKTNYNLRDITSGLSLPKPRTNDMKNIVSCMTEHTFGILIPKEIRESKTLSSFRNKIAAHKIDIE
jgi:hypothetical protein